MRIDIFVRTLGRHRAVLGSAALSGCAERARSRSCTEITASRLSLKFRRALLAAAIVILFARSAVAADIAPGETNPVSSTEPAAFEWTGFYLGGHIGYAWGNSDWTASMGGARIASGSIDLAQPVDSFNEAGSWFGGLQTGYNYMLANRLVIGAEADATFPAYPNPAGLSIGGTSAFSSPRGPESYTENLFATGTVRARIGYAPGNWLFYGTGGLAWAYDQQTLTQLSSGTAEAPYTLRWGWAAGGGVEGPIAPHWTGRLEYLFTGYGSSSVTFPAAAQRFNSDLSLQELRLGLNYQFGNDAASSEKDSPAPSKADADGISFHGQATFVEQGYPPIRSPYQGPYSLPGGGQSEETTDLTLYAGMRLWQGAELWVDPEIDQGFGVGNTRGVAGYPSAEAYKLGLATPYARVQRYFIRQTIDLGGETEKVDADTNQFEGTTTAERLVLTVGKFAIVDIFDTNKYANNSKSDFLNWSVINAGTFDYAGDAWGFTYGGAAEWYTGRWTLRGGVFELSATPAGGISPAAYGLDPTFSQLEFVGEIEHRHDLWGQPGKLKITGYLEEGRMGSYADAIAVTPIYGYADINAVRTWHLRPGVSLNLEQQVSGDIGVFARAGWGDGQLEPWDFTDIDRTVEAGVSISGKQWGRPDDRVGVAVVINGISGIAEEFFNDGGLGILIGDGKLPNPGLEKILETYYSYALTSSTKLSFDYQFIDDPAYNTDRGPVNLFAGRFHWQF
ncbi:MAG: carbohydrate porin [Rhodomicrobium sp.]